MACVATHAPESENKNQISLNHYLDLTIKDGKKLSLTKQRMLFYKYWRVKTQKFIRPRDKTRKVQSGCVQVLVAVSEEGKMSSYGIIKSYPEGLYDEYAIINLKAKTWQPTEFNIVKNPVLTTMQVNMRRSGAANQGEATKACNWRR